MYNRYIPDANGVYSRQSIPEPKKRSEKPSEIPVTECQEPPQKPDCAPRLPKPRPAQGIDAGDLLLLCIILLLLIDSEEDDLMTILITAAAFLFLQ